LNPFRAFMTEAVTLRKMDGTVREKIPASVQRGKIIFFDATLSVVTGDRLSRPLPNGQVEEYVVENPHFSAAFEGIPAHWSLECRRADHRPKEPFGNTYNVTGNNSRINIHAPDYSTNVVHSEAPAVFNDLIHVITTQIADAKERDNLLKRVGELEETHGKASFLSKYQEFVTAAANHMTVLAPFLPALSALLK
jgi:hypothetical protein